MFIQHKKEEETFSAHEETLNPSSYLKNSEFIKLKLDIHGLMFSDDEGNLSSNGLKQKLLRFVMIYQTVA